MNRRHFLTRMGLLVVTSGLAGCGKVTAPHKQVLTSGIYRPDVFYDTYAMALYMDGSLGPKTGIIRAVDLIELESLDLEFWHGHGGKNHRFVVTSDDLSRMKIEKVVLETDTVASHSHKLFVDFHDERWRVPNSKPIIVP